MKTYISATAALMMSTGIAAAGGLDRTGQSVDLIFEEGDAVQFSISTVNPTVSGEAVAMLGGFSSGDMAESYTMLSAGVRQEVNDRLSYAVIFDQPFGADVSYAGADMGYYTGPATAEVNANAVTGLLRYHVNDRFSVHGGVRYETVGANVSKPTVAGYGITTEDSSAFGYVAGAAYEIPDIALRAALTYSTAITHDITSTETCAAPLPACAGTTATTQLTIPQSVNFDFQTGIAADTLLFGSIRWTQWTAFDFAPPVHAALGQGSLQSYDNDVMTYEIGVGRRFSDQFTAALTVGYEKPVGGYAGDLAPTDGYISLGLGGTYAMNDQTEISGGVRYIKIGDAETENPLVAGTTGSEFSGNSAIGLGLQILHRF